MSPTLDAIRAKFAEVSTLDQWHAFALRHALSSEGVKQSEAPQVLSIKKAVVDGVVVRATHRWYDPSGPFQNEPDMNKIRLEVQGMETLEIAFPD